MAITAEMRTLTDRHRIDQIVRSRQVDRKVKKLWRDFQAGRVTATEWERAMLVLAQSGYRSCRDLAEKYVKQYRVAAIGEQLHGDLAKPELDLTIAVRILRQPDVSPASPIASDYASVLAETRRMALRGGRDMVASTALRDRRSVGWRRVTDGDPCTFCAMVVSRGAVYKTSGAAGAYSNRNFKGPGSYKFHNHCGCGIEILYSDWEPTSTETGWVNDYFAAATQVDAEGLARTPENILPVMRHSGTYRDSPARRNVKPVDPAKKTASRAATQAAQKAGFENLTRTQVEHQIKVLESIPLESSWRAAQLKRYRRRLAELS